MIFLNYLSKLLAPYNKRYLEIGSFTGKSANAVCEANPEMEMVCIEPNIRRRFRRVAEKYNIQIIPRRSQKVNWKEIGLFDSIYIDGDHGRKPVTRDLKNCWRAWNENGIFFGDDYDPKYGVFKAVNRFFGIRVKSSERGGRRRLDLEELETGMSIKVFKEPRQTREGYLQLFGKRWLFFTEKMYKAHYDEIYNTTIEQANQMQEASRKEEINTAQENQPETTFLP